MMSRSHKNVPNNIVPGDYVSTKFFFSGDRERFGLVVYTYAWVNSAHQVVLPQAGVLWSDGGVSDLWFEHMKVTLRKVA